MKKIIYVLTMVLAAFQLSGCSNKANELAKIDLRDVVYYKAPSEVEVIHVFFDPMCNYCRHFINQIPKLTELGVTVELLIIAPNTKSKDLGVKIWCSPNKKQALNDLVADREIKSNECDNPIDKNTAFASKIGIAGTPAVYTSNGHVIGGYSTAENYLKKIKSLK